ncbi:MAG: methyltransferase protein [Frankiales bacterium]|nr:methyltransferase protein [Frankiales bacterium]
MTTIALEPADAPAVEALAERLFMASLATMELANVELGLRLGLYESLAQAGPLSAAELARAAGIVERYAQEWLEQQAVAGVVEVDDAGLPAADRRFSLPNGHAHVLLDDDSEASMKACVGVVPWLGKALDVMTEEFRAGKGVAFGDFDLHGIQEAFTRPVFVNHLTQSWLPALPEVQNKLSAGEGVRIAEIGCGTGVAALIIARAYANAQVDGYDLDPASVAAANEAAASQGLADRARFHLRDAADPAIAGDYDLVMAVEMLHDVPDPVGVLRTMRRLAGETGAVLVADERTEEDFTVPAGEMERFFYAFSTLHCLAVSMQSAGVGTGTVMRPATLRRCAEEAGFSTVAVLPVEHPQFVLYQLS